jgi:hypothetical protein
MKIAIYEHKLPHALPHLQSFSEGLRKHGQKYVWVSLSAGAPVAWDLAVFWGHKRKDVIEAQRSAGRRYLVLERGFIAGRFRWTAAGYDGLNGRADFCNTGVSDTRFRAHFEPLLRPWRNGDGKYVLLIGQCRFDQSVVDLGMLRVLAKLAADLKACTDRPIRFRPHPHDPQVPTPAGTTLMCGTLEEALNGAHAVVTINSNTGVDAAFAGVPVIAVDRGSMAWPVAGHSAQQVLQPPRPDRWGWAVELAWCQWTDQEMSSGDTWAHLQKGMDAVHISVNKSNAATTS